MQKGNTPKMKDSGNAGKKENTEDQQNLPNNLENQAENNASEDDGSPVLDEEDLEENNLTDEEAEDVEWDGQKENSQDPKKDTPGSSGL